MAKSKALTPQEIYRQRRKREENEKTAYLPPGLINHGNTCFMNSVLQGLIATRLLADLVYFNPIPPEIQVTAPTVIVSRRSPQLTNGHNLAGSYEQPWVNTMPIGDMFLTVMYKAWNSQAARKREILSPKPILGALGQKYDQYLDFAQQDAHEFLRILLDAMRMEEQDIIKKRQPPKSKTRRRTTITPNNLHGGVDSESDLPLLSFSDMIFGGQLTSILVCQKCKHVSQSYEEFNDISLSIKAEDYMHNRKRDRFKKIVGRLTQFPGSSSQSKEHGKLPVQLPLQLPLVPAHAVEILRSSSVPPSPRTEREGVEPGHYDLPIVNPPRRRSLDMHVGATEADPDSQETLPNPPAVEVADSKSSTDRDDDVTLESENSHILVNVTGPEDKHVDFVEPGLSRKEKHDSAPVSGTENKSHKNEDNSWAKIGRRISLSVGLGRPRGGDKERDRKERDRKSRSMDRGTLAVPGAIKEDIAADTGLQKSLSASATPGKTSSSSTDSGIVKSRIFSEGAIPSSRLERPSNSTASTSSPIKALKSLPSRPTPSTSSLPASNRTPSPRPSTQNDRLNPDHHAASSSTSIFPNAQRSKSPKPPKPTPAETEYLRKILADVASSPTSTNPFAMFKPPMLHSHSSHHTPRAAVANLSSGGAGEGSSAAGAASEKSAAASWLGMGVRNFSGIEECLRMFTAVEVLDGENMVGCRRCWKIQNGMLHTSKGKDSDQDDEDDDEDDSSRKDSTPQPVSNGATQDPSTHKSRPLLKPLSTSHITAAGTHIPTSISTPTVSVYIHPNTNDMRSTSSLPLETTSLSDASEDSPLNLSVISESSARSNSSLNPPEHGPGGLPIPVISTTAPDTPTISSTYAGTRSSVVAESLGEADRNPTASTTSVPSPHPRLTQALYGYNPSSGSKDSLVIPPRKPASRRTYSDTTRTDDDSDDQSDTSSVSADSVASRDLKISTTDPSQSSQQQLAPAPAPVKQKKPSKPKPVIMRPAYKRYLIATPPPVLVIHLKRFQQTTKTPLMSFSHGFKKLDDYVSFPEHLDLVPFLAPKKEDYGLGKKGKDKKMKEHPKDERCMYRLYAVVVHIGNMLGGHYIAYTALPEKSSDAPTADKTNNNPEKTPSITHSASDKAGLDKEFAKPTNPDSTAQTKQDERQWAYISDTVVRLTTLEEVLHAKAYICMYERC